MPFYSLNTYFCFAREGTGIESIVLTILNAMMITAASMGGYEVLSDPLALKVRR